MPQKSVPPPPPPPRLEGSKPSGSRQDTAAGAAAAEEGPGDAGAEVGSRLDSLSLRHLSPSARIATISWAPGRVTLSPLASSARRAARLCERQGGQGERAGGKKALARAWRRSGCGCGPPARRARSPAWSRGRRRRRRGLFLEPAVALRPMISCTAVPRRQQHRVRRSLFTGRHPTERGGVGLAATSA